MGFFSGLKKLLTPGNKYDIGGQLLGINKDTSAADKAAADAATAAQQSQDAALAQAKATADQQAQYQQSLLNIQSNAAALSNANADTTAGNVADVVAGGTAAGIAKKKKATATTGLASTLGINLGG